MNRSRINISTMGNRPGIDKRPFELELLVIIHDRYARSLLPIQKAMITKFRDEVAGGVQRFWRSVVHT